MKKSIFILGLIGLFFISCQSKTNETPVEETTTENETPVPDAHNARTSLDYTGTYAGVLPCADCEGIQTEITLNPDETYEIKRVYLKDDHPEFTETGSYAWEEDGNTLQLEDTNSDITYIFVSENKIIQLDLEGNKITGDLADKYILTKK